MFAILAHAGNNRLHVHIPPVAIVAILGYTIAFYVIVLLRKSSTAAVQS